MDKYELLACSTFLSEFDTAHSSIEATVKDPKPLVWELFENYSPNFVIEEITNLAYSMRTL